MGFPKIRRESEADRLFARSDPARHARPPGVTGSHDAGAFTPLRPAARFGAAAIDLVVVSALLVPLLAVPGALGACEALSCARHPLTWAIGVALLTVYVLGWWRAKLATPGKIALRAIVVDATTGAEPSWRQLITRWFGLCLSCLLLGLGLLAMFSSPAHQAFHDRLANTLVVRQRERAHYGATRGLRFVLTGAVIAALIAGASFFGATLPERGRSAVESLLHTQDAYLPDTAFAQHCLPQPAQPPEADRRRIDRDVHEATAAIDGARGRRSALEKARGSLNEVLRQDPCHAPAYRQYARYHLRLAQLEGDPGRRLREAERSVRRAIAVSPGYAEAWVLYGFIHHLAGQDDKADLALDQAERLGATDPWLHVNRALIARARGQLLEAARHYRRVLDGPARERTAVLAAYDGIAEYLIAAGEHGKAEQVYQARIEFSPSEADGHIKLARLVLCQLDDSDRALVHLQKAMKLAGRSPPAEAEDVLAASHARRWAGQVTKTGLAAQRLASKSLAQVNSYKRGTPSEAILAVCRAGPAVAQVQHAAASHPLATASARPGKPAAPARPTPDRQR